MKSPNNLTVRVARGMQILQIIFSLPFTLGSLAFVYFIVRGNTGLIVPLIIFMCLSYLGWANAFSCIVIDDECVKVKVFYGIFRINWNEVKSIAMNDTLIALSGDDKRVVLSLAFSNREKENLFALLLLQSQKRQIIFKKTDQPLQVTHLNSRVWK